MKNKSYIVISFVVLVFGIIFIPDIIKRIKSGSVVDNNRHAIGLESYPSEELVKLASAPAFEFVNQYNDTISNKNYDGKVYVVEFFFTTCPTICPIMNKNMVKLQNAFKGNDNFGIASFTINPAHDTPKILKDYADKYGVTNPNWHMMTGDVVEIHNLSVEGFDLYAGRNEKIEGGFEHSGQFALIDKEGNIRCRKDTYGNPIFYYDGTDERYIEMIKLDIKTLLNE